MSFPRGIKFPFDIDIRRAKTEMKKTIEIDIGPNRIGPGEIRIHCVSQWFGLKIICWAIQNVDGKHMVVRLLPTILTKPHVSEREKSS